MVGGYRISREKLDIHDIYPVGLDSAVDGRISSRGRNVVGKVFVFWSVIAPSGDEVFLNFAFYLSFATPFPCFPSCALLWTSPPLFVSRVRIPLRSHQGMPSSL